MRFRRYTVFIYTYYIVFGLIFLLELYIFSSYAIQEERYVIIPVYILSYILFATIMYFMLRWVPESEGGHINDYIILTNDRIELHGKQAEASIDWLEVTEIREVILWRGMRKIKVIARDGRWISFESSGKWEKKIWGMHPELKVKYRRRCNH